MFPLTLKEFDNTKNPSREHTYILVYMSILWAFYVISVYINPDTFENSVLVSNRSLSTWAFSKSFSITLKRRKTLNFLSSLQDCNMKSVQSNLYIYTYKTYFYCNKGIEDNIKIFIKK